MMYFFVCLGNNDDIQKESFKIKRNSDNYKYFKKSEKIRHETDLSQERVYLESHVKLDFKEIVNS